MTAHASLLLFRQVVFGVSFHQVPVVIFFKKAPKFLSLRYFNRLKNGKK